LRGADCRAAVLRQSGPVSRILPMSISIKFSLWFWSISCVVPFHFTIIARNLLVSDRLFYSGLTYPQASFFETCLGGVSRFPTIATLNRGSCLYPISFLFRHYSALFLEGCFCNVIEAFIILLRTMDRILSEYNPCMKQTFLNLSDRFRMPARSSSVQFCSADSLNLNPKVWILLIHSDTFSDLFCLALKS
jgi:hypothetical protein